MPDIREHLALTYEIEAPLCIAVTDDRGHPFAFARKDDARLLTNDSVIAQARNASSHRVPSASLPEVLERRLAFAARGKVTNLPGGLPILMREHIVSGFGVGSGTGEQGAELGGAGLAALHRVKGWCVDE